ncbi:hypothetical protein BO82DRAFT_401848 [Aspergillus uvarum CBS 121591]|uniref:Uncharacterized protein n=1 Tax=Aspergillus uvarum CBS 121591 TaxID=1448315 RepID=A0A319C9H9_9EURO|nr:hypothetical protein BO82DRAFT_401848 [Aspergillus uvarum CBS 121591]PYH81924.1 hypothetical protein BO82DRAFT_401848 [Aspergillus uvarum CBS 121591]
METCLEEFGSELLERLEVQVLVELQKTDVSPTAAVQRLLQAREIPPQKGDEPPSSKNAGNHAWFTIFSLVELASLTPAAQQVKLIEFVAQLQKIPVIDPATEQQLIVADDLNVWTDLPYRRIYLADRSGFRNVKGNYTEAEEYPPAEVQEWENRNAFMAQLTAAAVELGHPMDFSLYGLRAACIWFIHAGARMWENCQARQGLGDPRYFDLPRLRRWEEGLRTAQREFTRESTQELIQKALTELWGAQSRIH